MENNGQSAPKKKIRKSLPVSFHYTLMTIPGFAWMFAFSIVPMVGILMAFQNYQPKKGWFGSPWVGLDNFTYLMSLGDVWNIVRNTLVIAIGKLVLNIIIPLVFAILLNEIKNMAFKKTVQTIVYLPHFISWVILANIVSNIFGYFGIFNTVYTSFGNEPKMWLTDPNLFQGFVIGTDVWKEFGYNAVVFLAALTGISPSLYEAAAIDGASRWQSIRNITLPALIPTVVLLTTLAMGNVLNAGFDQVFNMYSPMVYSTGDIIDTYVYRIGITNMQFSLATAVGLFKSVVSFTLITVSYVLAYKFADYTIF
ncbi:MAG: sugar ABC transporter permease [Acutalibacter sp.]|jgi:putative aldouronate transport system permease protein|nr:sugar ABC transporter permease [Acutalibacter sp.]